MIIELVTFDRPEGFSERDLLEDGRSTVSQWQSNRELVRKLFATNDQGQVAGIYTWPSREAAQAAHDAAWIERFRTRTGREPSFAYWDVFMVIDNEAGEVHEGYA